MPFKKLIYCDRQILKQLVHPNNKLRRPILHKFLNKKKKNLSIFVEIFSVELDQILQSALF